MTEDLVIIGGGPAGCTAAIYAARAALQTVVLDRGLTSGALGLSKRVDNFPGLPRIAGAELVELMRQQAEQFGARFIQDRVTGVELQKDTKQVYTNTAIYESRALIIATGSMGRVSTVPGEEKLIGKGVSYCATCDGAFFRGKPVAVVGDTEEAAEEARYLARFSDTIYLITRKSDVLWDLPAQVTLITGAVLKEIIGDNAVSALLITKGGQEESIPLKGVFIYLQGNRPVTDFLGGALSVDNYGCLQVNEEMQTSITGVFAAGDVLCPEVKQAVIAAAEGSKAAMHVIKYLTRKKTLAMDWK